VAPAVAAQADVVVPAQLPPDHAQPVAAGTQLAVNVTGVPTTPAFGPVTVQAGGPPTAGVQVSVVFVASQVQPEHAP